MYGAVSCHRPAVPSATHQALTDTSRPKPCASPAKPLARRLQRRLPSSLSLRKGSFSNVDDVGRGFFFLFHGGLQTCVEFQHARGRNTLDLFWVGEKARNCFKTRHLKGATTAATIVAAERIRMKEGNYRSLSLRTLFILISFSEHTAPVVFSVRPGKRAERGRLWLNTIALCVCPRCLTQKKSPCFGWLRVNL